MKFFAISAFLMLTGGLFAAEKILYQDNYDSNTDLPVRVKGANQPYDINFIGLAEEGRAGKCVKVDVKAMHGFQVCLAPRTNAKARATWGNPAPGKSGSFYYPSLNIPLRPDKGYVVSVWMKLPKGAKNIPLHVEVEISFDTPHGKNYAFYRLDQFLNETRTGEWVKFEQEINSGLMDKLQAGGDGMKNLAISSIAASGFIIGKQQFAFMADDLKIIETDYSRVLEEKKKKESRYPGKEYTFKNIPNSENVFVWGAYGNPWGGFGTWCERSNPKLHEHVHKVNKNRRMLPVSLPLMKRHYFNSITVGGGMIFSTQGDLARKYVVDTLNYMEKYKMKLVPSTYVSDYYSRCPWPMAQNSIKKLTDAVKNHPALLAYLLVDEPEYDRLDNFFRGKAEMEKNDPNHSAICCANNVTVTNVYAKKIPLYIIDFYPVSTVPKSDRGVWAIVDNVKYARTNGAQNVWVAAQLFGGVGGWRTPTLPEFKIMYYGCLAEGATGFMPYGLSQGAIWSDPNRIAYSEGGQLLDPFDNPTVHMKWKTEIAPLFRSAGPLFLRSVRMDDAEINSSNKETFENAVGRIRPKVGRVLRKTADGKAKLFVCWNNHLAKNVKSTLSFPKMGRNEQIMDCSTLKLIPGRNISVDFAPGDGKIYVIATPEELRKTAEKIRRTRAEIEKERLAVDILDLENMKLDVSKFRPELKKAETLFQQKKYEAAEQTSLAAMKKINSLRASEQPLADVEKIRILLGEEHRNLSGILRKTSFPVKDAALRQRMSDIKEFGTKLNELQIMMRKTSAKAQAGAIAALRKSVEQKYKK